jgi:hypothetical protein
MVRTRVERVELFQWHIIHRDRILGCHLTHFIEQVTVAITLEVNAVYLLPRADRFQDRSFANEERIFFRTVLRSEIFQNDSVI